MPDPVRFVPLPAAALEALLRGDLDAASDACGAPLPLFFLDEGWLWQVRLDQVRSDPRAADWVVRAAALPDGEVVGHAGFHGPPDERGTVEVAYTVVPERRGRGLAHALLAALLREAAEHPDVTTVRASVSPDNVASLAVVRAAGFVQTGEQWDEEDGLELVLERPARAAPRDGQTSTVAMPSTSVRQSS